MLIEWVTRLGRNRERQGDRTPIRSKESKADTFLYQQILQTFLFMRSKRRIILV
jgi:hypothetical protein